LMCASKWRLGVLAQLQVQDPWEAVFGVWTQGMVVKAPSRYWKRFATWTEWFGWLVVKKTGLMCASKWQLGVLAQLQVQVRQDPWEAVFGVWTQGIIVKAPSRYGEWFATRMEWFGWLVVKKTWLMCASKWRLGVLAQLQVQVRQDPWEAVFGVRTQGIVVKAPLKYGERFANDLEWVGWVVVKKVEFFFTDNE
jgi:hypothetical protein